MEINTELHIFILIAFISISVFFISWVIFAYQIYKLKVNNTDIKNENALLKRAINVASIGIYTWDSRTDKWNWSPKLFEIRGFSHDNNYGVISKFFSSIHPEDRARVIVKTNLAQSSEGDIYVEYRAFKPDGTFGWFSETMSTIKNPDNSFLLTGVVVDISDKRRISDKNLIFSFVDDLTGLPNRQSFDRKLLTYFDSNEKYFLLTILSISNLKDIKHKFGTESSSSFVVYLSELLQKNKTDNNFIFALSEDEFAIIADTTESLQVNSYIQINDLLSLVYETLKKEFPLIDARISAGISSYPYLSKSPREILSHADSALQSAIRSSEKFTVYDYLPSEN